MSKFEEKTSDYAVDYDWNKAVEKINFAFQPIVDLRAKRIFGFEALLRNYQEAGFQSIFQFFDVAFQEKVLYGIDLLLREKLLSLFVQFPDYRKRRLFYNIDNRILEMPNFESGNTVKLLKKYNLPNSTLIFEISERFPFHSYENLSKIIYNYKNQEFKIAIDDFGIGYSSLKLIYSAEPEILKLDRFFVSNIHKDLRKKLFVEQIVHLAHLIGGRVIAEGVETKEELITCMKIGIDLAQGHYIAPPFFIEEYNEILPTIEALFHEINVLYDPFITDNEFLIKEIHIEAIPPIKNTSRKDEVLEHLQNYSKYSLFPVVNEHDEPEGILYEKELKRHFLSTDNFSHHTLKELMKKTYVLDSKIDLFQFLETLSLDEDLQDQNFFEIIITENGVYKGVITAENLLKYVFRKQLLVAKETNPLTQLPGSSAIKRFINTHKNFIDVMSIAYIDIQNFKNFNEAFGFDESDKLISYLGTLLKNTFRDKHVYFLGHIESDDFIVFTKYKSFFHILKSLRKIQKEFDKHIKNSLPKEIIHNGFFTYTNRFGFLQKSELPKLSVGVLYFQNQKELPVDELFLMINDLKYQSKDQTQRSIFYKVY
ncbi:MAG: GGDEF domain-containing protein [Leptospiraceae bacterium]|nr:GGDEF domain-containing protein [Leptospiraceae bacterium]MDW7976021.1 GGDEF domain-containing protein [Leptospiraceae bacterium]